MLLSRFILILGLVSLSLGDDGGLQAIVQRFVFPAWNSTAGLFIENDLVNVTWTFVTPRLSLFETCGYNGTLTSSRLESNVSNTYSFVWRANRDLYHEPGCCYFQLESRTSSGDILAPGFPNNFTSGGFEVNQRVSGEPTLFNGYTATSTAAPAPSSIINLTASLDWTNSPVSSTSAMQTVSSTSVLSSSTTTQPASANTAKPVSTNATALVLTGPPVPQPRLSKAVKVGIGVGVPLGISLSASSASLLLLLVYRRRLRKRVRGHEDSMETIPELTLQRIYRFNIPDSPATGGASVVVELEGCRPIAELMGTPCSELA